MKRLGVLLMLVASPCAAAERWSGEFRLGAAWNLPTSLVIRQDGEPDVRIRATYQTRALKFPLYYTARVARWDGDQAWALSLTHHKLHLTSPPPEVGEFSISHGYNLLTAQRLFGNEEGLAGLEMGVVVAHPENEVRGRRLDEQLGMLGTGYYAAGPTVGALGGWMPPGDSQVFLSAEVRITYSYARVPVAGGSASVPNAALHASLGLGWTESR